MRLTIAKLFSAMSVIAVLLVVSVWWRGLAILWPQRCFPLLLFDWRHRIRHGMRYFRFAFLLRHLCRCTVSV